MLSQLDSSAPSAYKSPHANQGGEQAATRAIDKRSRAGLEAKKQKLKDKIAEINTLILLGNLPKHLKQEFTNLSDELNQQHAELGDQQELDRQIQRYNNWLSKLQQHILDHPELQSFIPSSMINQKINELIALRGDTLN